MKIKLTCRIKFKRARRRFAHIYFNRNCRLRGKIKRIGGEFSFYEIGAELFDEDGFINSAVPFEKICEYIYFSETGKNFIPCAEKNLLGVNNDTAYYIFKNLSLAEIKTKARQYTIYAEICNLSEAELSKYKITFKQIPFDVRRY